MEDISAELGLNQLTKQAILGDRDAPLEPKKTKAKKSKSDSEDSGTALAKIMQTKLTATEMKRYQKATAAQMDDADYDMKKGLIDKISEYIQAFPAIDGAIAQKWPKFEKKPYSLSVDELKQIKDDCIREVNRPAAVDMTRSVFLAGIKGLIKVNEWLGTGKDYRDADIRMAAELNKKEWDYLLQQVAIKYGITNVPVELLLLKKTWDVLDDQDKINKMDRMAVNVANVTPPQPAELNRFSKKFTPNF